MNIATIHPTNLTLDFVKKYLRVEHDFDDVEIGVAISSAIAYVRKYTKCSTDELDYDLVVPILNLVAHIYENKGAMNKSNEKMNSILSSILDLNREDIL